MLDRIGQQVSKNLCKTITIGIKKLQQTHIKFKFYIFRHSEPRYVIYIEQIFQKLKNQVEIGMEKGIEKGVRSVATQLKGLAGICNLSFRLPTLVKLRYRRCKIAHYMIEYKEAISFEIAFLIRLFR